MVQSTENTPIRRARVACKACNARRVKCDAADGQPCWHCRIRRTSCELIESRRGKYTRKRNGQSRGQHGSPRPQEVGDTSTNQAVSPDAVDSTIAPDQIDDIHSSSEQTNASPRQNIYLSYIVEVVHSPIAGSAEPLKVHYPIPASIIDRASLNHGPRADESVTLRDAFRMPTPGIADQLIRAFFDIIHPAYPVFDREKVTRLYHQGQASPLVLQTIFMLGFTVGSENLVRAAGYNDRATARKTHYLRAKALYDADYETDRMNLVAVLLLLGFWWAGYEEQKDTCYWVGTSQCALSPQIRSLRKRIWWSIYVRDRHTSAAFGQPCRIRDEDCDIEPLTEEDFNFDVDYDERLIPAQRDFYISYALRCRNWQLYVMGDILVAEFSPRRAARGSDTEELADRLVQWKSKLPGQLRELQPDGPLGASFWASMLHFSYQNYHILLFRPKAIENLSPAEIERDARARTAADTITRMAEDLLSAGTIKSAQIHLVPALFGALSIHTIVICRCRKDPVRRQLAENKSRQCMLALSVLANSWPVRIWISKAFVNLMRRLTGQEHSVLHADSAGDSSHDIDGNSPDRREPSAQVADSNAPDYFPPTAADQLIYDPFSAGYGCLDGMFDIDSILPNSLAFDGLGEIGEPNASDF
ncbi:hypothetical protein SI65_03415 [Aspergillus cristatus]|uniref:Zn(2)-C6 fungal-type domain-containing protein n=1 Tax=Aspergillus cristatus TaxID=573508 RepID=A0A1E3BHB4_ASPCR|nr:hypothetical protein SI65_03415 [Aspergillus cristatus]